MNNYKIYSLLNDLNTSYSYVYVVPNSETIERKFLIHLINMGIYSMIYIFGLIVFKYIIHTCKAYKETRVNR